MQERFENAILFLWLDQSFVHTNTSQTQSFFSVESLLIRVFIPTLLLY